MLPIAHWWALRRKFKQSIPGVVTDNYIATVLNMDVTSARANVLPDRNAANRLARHRAQDRKVVFLRAKRALVTEDHSAKFMAEPLQLVFVSAGPEALSQFKKILPTLGHGPHLPRNIGRQAHSLTQNCLRRCHILHCASLWRILRTRSEPPNRMKNVSLANSGLRNGSCT